MADLFPFRIEGDEWGGDWVKYESSQPFMYLNNRHMTIMTSIQMISDDHQMKNAAAVRRLGMVDMTTK